MNNLKRILFVVAIVAVSASCFAMSVGAEYTVDNYDSILEYYEPVFGYEKFDDKELGAYTDGIINEWTSRQPTEIVAEGDNKYLTLSSNSFPFYSSNLFLNMNADESERLLLSFKVKGDRVDYEGNLPIVSVFIGSEALDPALDAADCNTQGLCLVKLDFNTGKAMYYTNRLRDYIELEGFTLAESTWYSVDIIYNVVESGYSVSVTNTENELETVTKDDIRIPLGYDTIKNVRIGMSVDDIYAGSQSAVLSLDDVFAYSGSFYRDPTAKYSQTVEAFADFIAIVENPEVDSEAKIAILNVFDKIVNEFGYVAEDDEAAGYVATLRDYQAMLYVNYVAGCTDFIDPNGDYATRKANIDAVKEFYDAIPADYSFLDAEKKARLESVKLEYEEEQAFLSAIEDDCLAFLTAFDSVDINTFNYEDYSLVDAVYQQVKDLALIDFTYPGMAQHSDSYKRIINNQSKISTVGDEFIASINGLKEATTFADAYFYYRAAADVKEAYLNETYPGVTDALTVFTAFVNDTEVLKLEADSEIFVLCVSRADFALYLSEKTKHYDDATPYFTTQYDMGKYGLIVGVHDAVEGVADAKALYDAVAAYVEYATEAATRYIEAVIALEGLTGSALEEAVINALILKTDGDVDGFELVKDGVTYKMSDINVILSEISTQISLANGNCQQFITYVNMIGKATTIAERYACIRRALAAKVNVDLDAEGVSEAVALLESEIAAYRNAIAGANKSVSGGTAAESSAAVRSRAKDVAPRMVAFIGSYGKED